MDQNWHRETWISVLFSLVTLCICGRASADVYRGPPDFEELALKQGGLTGAGLTFIDGSPFVRVQMEPEATLGKIGFGLDFVLLYRPNTEEGEPRILAEDGETWGNASTMLRAVRYIRYARPHDPFYARFGELDGVTIGHGFIMSGYSNYDRRGLRANLRAKTRQVGVEILINDVGSPTIFGGRLYVRPLRKGDSSRLGQLEFGATYLMDTQPNRILDDETDYAEKTINEVRLSAFGSDVGFPLIENGLLRLELYDDLAFLHIKPDYAQETGTAIGNAFGLGLSISKALFKVEYRSFGQGFVPTIFDYSYQSSGIAVIPAFLGMLEASGVGKARRGYFSMFAWRPIPKLHAIGTFEDYNVGAPKLYAGITESGLVPKMSFRAFYTKRDIGEPETGFPNAEDSEDPSVIADIFKLDEKSAFIVRVGYAVYSPLEVAVRREFRFRQIEGVDGEIEFETIQKTSFEVGMNLQF